MGPSMMNSRMHIASLLLLSAMLLPQQTVLAQGLDLPGSNPAGDPQSSPIPGADVPQSSPIPGVDDPGPGCGTGGGSCELESDVGSAPGGNLPNTGVGNPIDLMTGNKHQREVDFEIPGAMLSLKRMYNSGNSESNRGLGQGWHHSYAASLFDAGNGSREIVQSIGGSLRFTEQGTNESGHPLLRATQPNHGYLSYANERHLWHLPDGRTLTFNGSFLVHIDWPDQRELKLYYRSRRLSTVTDETGRTLTFRYSGDGRAVSLPSFEKNRFTTATGYLESVTLPDGSEIGYDYDHNRNLTRVRYPDETTREYHYENELYPHHLTGLTDRTGVRFATWSYDAEGRANSSEHAGGVERVTLVYPDAGAVANGEVVQTMITNSLGYESTYTWQQADAGAEPRLLESEGAGCATCPETGYAYAYDKSGRLLRLAKTDRGTASGKEGLTYAYDEQGRVVEIRRIDSAGVDHLVERREYINTSLLPWRIIKPSVNPDGERLTEIERNERSLPVRITERGYAPWLALPGESDHISGIQKPSRYRLLERIVSFEYENGRLVSIDGARTDVDDVVDLGWDDRKRMTSIASPVGPTLTLGKFDELGRVTSSRVGSVSPTSISYDERGRVARIEYQGSQLDLVHDAESRLSAYTDADGHTTRLERDDAGRIVGIVDSFGIRSESEFNTESLILRQSRFSADGALIRALGIAYDARGRVERRDEERFNEHGGYDSWQSRYERSGDGTVVASVDEGTGSRFEFLVDILENTARLTNHRGETTRHDFDRLGQEAGIEDARGTNTRRYRDDFGGIVGVISPDAGVERYERDNQGQVVRRVQEDTGSTLYVRDAVGRAIKRLPERGTETHWTHDAASGRVSSARHGSIAEKFEYDSESMLLSHTRLMDGHVFSTTYTRDTRGRIVSRKLPDGRQLRYLYHVRGNEAGTLASISLVDRFGLRKTPLVKDVDLVSQDGETGWRHHNGIRTIIGHTRSGALQRVDVSDTLSIDYESNSTGQVLSQIEAGRASRYAYEGGRLVAADTENGQYRYRYDEAGNRTGRYERHADGTLIDERSEYAIGPEGRGAGNRLTVNIDQMTGERRLHEYSRGGALLRRNGLEYKYDSERRPLSVHRNGREIVRYAYNAFGERVKKEVHETSSQTRVRYYLYDGSRLTAEATERGEITAHFIYIDTTRAVIKLEGDEIFAIHGDRLGTPRRMTNVRGEVVWSASYEPFGLAKITSEAVSLDLRFPGQVFDEETETHYNYYRDYDPTQGRYITSDPIGLSGGVNTYLYAQADPLGSIDPLGLRIILMDRDLNGVPVGRHMFIVIIPDRPEDFDGMRFDIGGGSFEWRDVGNGEMGYVIGAQNIGGRLIAEAFNGADETATNQFFDPDSAPFGWGNFDPNASQCTLPVDPLGAHDTAAIMGLMADITNYNANEERQNIEYPGNRDTILGGDEGFVNSNSWALSVLASAGITPDETNAPGFDLLGGNRIDEDYFTSNPSLEDLTAENTDTDQDGVLDARDEDDDNDGVPDAQDAYPRDSSRQ